MKTALGNILRLMKIVLFAILISTVFTFSAQAALGEQPEFQQQSQTDLAVVPQIAPQEDEATNVLQAAIESATRGPATIQLINQGTINVPKGYMFIPLKEATALMLAYGNQTNSEFVGILMPNREDSHWYMTIDFIESGYIKDDEAKNWNTDDLLNSLKRGTEEANKYRISKGFPAVDILGWIETPSYNPSKHQLIWSMLAKSDSSQRRLVNYNTYALGRDGYFELDLITSEATIAEDKIDANKLLSNVHYNDGKRYEDFSAGTDRVAEYGLAALVTGVVAKKLGLLALAGVFLAKIWKFAILFFVIFWGMIKKFFKKTANSNVEK